MTCCQQPAARLPVALCPDVPVTPPPSVGRQELNHPETNRVPWQGLNQGLLCGCLPLPVGASVPAS